MVTRIRALRESFFPLLLVLVSLLGLALYMDARAERVVEEYAFVTVGASHEAWSADQLGDDGMDASEAGLALDLEAASKEALKARALADKGRFEAAVKVLEEALARDPVNPVLMNELGVDLLRLDRTKEAIEQLSNAIEVRPNYFRAFYNRAIAQKRQNNLDAAIEDYERAVALQPNHFESSYNLGLIRLERREYGSAEKVLQEAVKLGAGESRAEALFSLARAKAKLGKEGEAIRLYEKSIEYRPNYILPRFNLAILLFNQEDARSKDQARRYLDDVIALRPDFAPAYFVLGRFAAKSKKLDDAIKWYKTAEKTDPSFWKARHNLGLAYLDMGDFKRARQHFTEMKADYPNREEIEFNLGRVAYAEERYDEALLHYRAALDKADGKYAEAELNLGITLNAMKKRDEALAVFDGLLERKPAYGAALLNKALVLVSRKRYDEAREALTGAENAGVSKEKVYYNLGLLSAKEKHYEDAVAAYQRVLETNPRHLKSALNLGVALGKLKRFDEAEAAYRQAVAISPSYTPAHINLALILRKADRWAEAIEEYKAVVALDESNQSAWHNLGVAYAKLGQTEQAAEVFAKVLEMDPSSVKTRYNLALQYKKLRRFEDAAKELRQVLKLSPDHFQSHLSLGEILGERGRRSEALALLNRAVSLKPDDPDAQALLAKYQTIHK